MDSHIVAVYCLCADMLNALHHRNAPQCQLTDVEVMTIALVAAFFFGGKYTVACAFLRAHHSMPRMLSASRFSRRLHRIKDLLLTLFAVLGDHYKTLNRLAVSIIDSFPIASCDNSRIKRSRRRIKRSRRTVARHTVGTLPANAAMCMASGSTWSSLLVGSPSSAFWCRVLTMTRARSSGTSLISPLAPGSLAIKPSMYTRLKTTLPRSTSPYVRCARRTPSARCQAGSSTSANGNANILKRREAC